MLVRGGVSLAPSVDGTIEIPVGGSAGFTWSANSPDGTKHAVGPTPMALGMVSLTLGGADRVAFAVYSADDDSLDFYKRMDVPAKGSVFERKTVTEIYMGIESDVYNKAGGDWYGAVTTPWYGRRNDILSINVIDDGIVPKELSYYFQNLENATSIDISKFSPPESQGLFHTFSGCTKLTDIVFGSHAPETLDSSFTNCKALVSVDLRPLNLGNVRLCPFVFAGCSSLKTIDGVSDIGKANPYRIEESFLGCSSLESLDLSGWNTSYAVMDNGQVVRLFDECPNLRSVKIGSNWTWNQNGYGLLPIQSFDGADGKWYSLTTGKGYAPADIPSGKADTYVASKELLPKVAFAVYSEEDGSFVFYKRAFCDVPAAGDAFDGKTVTSVYTGFEEETYSNQDTALEGHWYAQVPNTPWRSICKSIRSVKIVDDGITPQSINYWFYDMSNMTNIDVSKLNTSQCTDFRMTFGCCRSLNEIDVSRWPIDSLVDLNGTFLGCRLLKSLTIDGWDTSKVESYHCLFHGCYSLVGNAMQIAVDNLDVTDCARDFDYMFESCTQLDSIDLSSWSFGSAFCMAGMFSNCPNLQLDCSGWNVRFDTIHNDFNKDSPGVILPKSWQAGAFAVYSEGDRSLDFYKRSNCELPAVGSTFEGKTVAEVYTGIETTRYTPIDYNDSNGATNVPWYSRSSDCKSVSVVDNGIKPINLAFWFHRFKNCISFDVSKLDTSSTPQY